MKNYYAPKGSKISLDNGKENISIDLYSQEGLELLSNLWIKVGAQHKMMYEPKWLGRPIIQFPSDILAIQELIWEVKPDVIIETGIAHGGSALMSASMMQLIGKGRVIAIDIEIRSHNRKAIEEHPFGKYIEMIECSSTDAEVINRINSSINDDDKVLVILDSNHSKMHVLQELNLYSKFISKNSYIVAHDGAQAWVSEIPRGKAEWENDNPIQAIDEFLASNSDFIIDEYYTRQLITSSPYGFLKRVK